MHCGTKMVKFQNPVSRVARQAFLGNEFFAKCELLSGKGRQRHKLCLALLNGSDPFKQPINLDQTEKRETFFSSSSIVLTPAPRSQSRALQIWVQIETF